MDVMAREAWTDERLDDLANATWTQGFRRSDAAELRRHFARGKYGPRGTWKELGETASGDAKGRQEIRRGIDARVRKRVDAEGFDGVMNRTMQIGFGLIGAVLAGHAGPDRHPALNSPLEFG